MKSVRGEGKASKESNPTNAKGTYKWRKWANREG